MAEITKERMLVSHRKSKGNVFYFHLPQLGLGFGLTTLRPPIEMLREGFCPWQLPSTTWAVDELGGTWRNGQRYGSAMTRWRQRTLKRDDLVKIVVTQDGVIKGYVNDELLFSWPEAAVPEHIDVWPVISVGRAVLRISLRASILDRIAPTSQEFIRPYFRAWKDYAL
eukprot:GEMP01076143.1.p1 GENE.GEMP01076143.1~~GEMP01076143.1.p1  ORF type:complete len:168 (-),score=28.43 GEMP01076143.1:557-1060(-)